MSASVGKVEFGDKRPRPSLITRVVYRTVGRSDMSFHLELLHQEFHTMRRRPRRRCAVLELLESRTLLAGVGLQAEYFNDKDFTSLALTRTDTAVTFDWNRASPSSAMSATDFSVRWTGRVQPQFSQSYTFFTQADDGVRLWVNGQLLIDRWSDRTIAGDATGDGAVDTADFNVFAKNWAQASLGGSDFNNDGHVDTGDFQLLAANFAETVTPKEDSGAISLQAGVKYDIKLEYYNHTGQASAKLLWSSASQGKSVIPTANLYLPSPDVSYEHTVAAGQSLSNISPRPGDDVLLTGDWAKVSFPWSGTSSAPIHVWFADDSTVGNGQTGTVLSGARFLDIHNLHVTGVTNGIQNINAAAKIGSGVTLSDSLIENVTGCGLGITGSDVTVQRTTMQKCGHEGFSVVNSTNVLLRDCKILNNNNGVTNPPWKDDEHARLVNGLYYVSPNWEAGGNKIWDSDYVTLLNNETAYNTGPGFAFDYHNTNVTITGNYVHDNRGLEHTYEGDGIRLELSKDVGGFTVKNNRIERNTGCGVTLMSVRDVVLTGNSFVSNHPAMLVRNDDGRGGLTNILASGNTYSGNSQYAVWGNNFPLVNVVIEGKKL